MSLEKVKAHLEARGLADRIIIPERSSATVAEAAGNSFSSSSRAAASCFRRFSN